MFCCKVSGVVLTEPLCVTKKWHTQENYIVFATYPLLLELATDSLLLTPLCDKTYNYLDEM